MKITINDRLKSCGVLIVDDEENICSVIKEYFSRKLGFTRILTAHSGRQAIEVVSEVNEKIFVLILDINMPDMSGFGLMQYLANHHPFHVGVVLNTGYPSVENREVFIKSGSEKLIPINFVIKPAKLEFLANEVVTAVHQIVKKRLSNKLINCPDNLASKDIKYCIDKLNIQGGFNGFEKDDLIDTLEELMLCFSNNCYLASMGLAGRALEIVLKKRLITLQATYDDNWPIGAIISKINEIEPSNINSLSTLNNIANIINKYRIGAVHSKKNWVGPSRESTIMVLYGIIELLKAESSRIERNPCANLVSLNTPYQNTRLINRNKNALPIPST